MQKIRFVDVLKTYETPGIVPLRYRVDGADYTAKVKTTNTALVCPSCGSFTPVLTVTARGLCCRSCMLRQRPTVALDESVSPDE